MSATQTIRSEDWALQYNTLKGSCIQANFHSISSVKFVLMPNTVQLMEMTISHVLSDEYFIFRPEVGKKYWS